MATATPSLPSNVAMAMRYGAQAAPAIRRSQYLADALKSLSEQSNKPIQSGLELAARLGQTYLLKRAADKNDRHVLDAVAAQRKSASDAMAEALGGGGPALPGPPPLVNGIAPSAPGEPPSPAQSIGHPLAPQPVGVQPLPAAQPRYSPEDMDALTRMIATEAIGEGPQGMAAAGHVALNRLGRGYGGAKSLRDVVMAPHQFEGMSRAGQVGPQDYAAARQVAEGIASGRISDPTGGALNFLNPELQASLGRQQPSWAPQGQGQRIGRHVFYGGRGPAAQPPPMAQNVDQPGPIADQPFEVAASGPFQPGMMPSSAQPPQGGPAPGGSVPQAGPPGVAHYQPTPQEIAYFQALVSDPATYEQGMAYGYKLREKMAEALKLESTSVNGAPGTINPYTGEVRLSPIPQEAMTQVVPATSYNPAAAAGTMAQRDPLGNLKEAPGNPPAGYAAGPGGVLAPQQGGPADPYRPQPPDQGYRYQNGAQTVIPGGPAAIQAETQLRTDFEKAPEFRAYQRAAQIYSSMKEQVQAPGRIADINFVYGLATIFDPDSVVREGEQVVIRNSQALPDWLVGQINKVNGGQGIQYETRAQMLEAAGTRIGGMQQQVQSRAAFSQDVARRYGLDPRNVVPALPTFEPWKRPQGGPGRPPAPQAGAPAAAGSMDGAIAEKVRRGLPLTPQQQQRARTMGLVR